MTLRCAPGDVVEQVRHYDFGGGDQAVLLDGPEAGKAGTRWKVIAIGGTGASGVTPPPGWQVIDPVAGRALVELELVEGEYRETYLDFKEGAVKTRVQQPGYRVRLTNAPAYEDCFPDRDPLQEFYDEWQSVP